MTTFPNKLNELWALWNPETEDYVPAYDCAPGSKHEPMLVARSELDAVKMKQHQEDLYEFEGLIVVRIK